MHQSIIIYIQAIDITQQHNTSFHMLQPIPLKGKVMISQPIINLGHLTQIWLQSSLSAPDGSEWFTSSPPPPYACRKSPWLTMDRMVGIRNKEKSLCSIRNGEFSGHPAHSPVPSECNI
jgi:hypothetical protein